MDKDRTGATALIWAAASGSAACVKILLPVSDALVKGANELPALMGASSRGHAACVNILLPVSDPFAINDFGMTALMLAAWMNYEACVKLLLPKTMCYKKIPPDYLLGNTPGRWGTKA